MRLLILLAVAGASLARDTDWQPIVPAASANYAYAVKSPQRVLDQSSYLKILNKRPGARPPIAEKPLTTPDLPTSEHDTCNVYKVSMNQELFYQSVEYEQDVPDLKEFTLCMWTKFHNHSGDHPLFSYAVPDSPKEISAWVSNTAEASYFSMAVHGQTFFRLNYPLKLHKWYHSCQSWNGKTGEWQIWVNAERVGRGFHNRLVGHIIKGGGIALSGQEQSMLFEKDNLDHIDRNPGLMGEITMLQLYHVALTAGKAHKDHKHHHAHHFTHDGTPIGTSTPAPTEPPPPIPTPIGNGQFLVGGQIMRAPNLNYAGAQPSEEQTIPVQLPNGAQFQQQFVNGQLGNRIVAEQLLGAPRPAPINQYATAPAQFGTAPAQFSDVSLPRTTVHLSGSLLNPANVQYVDDNAQHSLFKRGSKRDKRDNPEKELEEQKPSKKDKRGLVALSDGSVVDEALLSPTLMDDEIMFQQSLLNGLAGFDGNLPVQNEQKETVDEREPAEAEVKAVMQICTGCSQEPFKKALILSWRTTMKKLYSGAHYYRGLPICRAF